MNHRVVQASTYSDQCCHLSHFSYIYKMTVRFLATMHPVRAAYWEPCGIVLLLLLLVPIEDYATAMWPSHHYPHLGLFIHLVSSAASLSANGRLTSPFSTKVYSQQSTPQYFSFHRTLTAHLITVPD